VTILDGGCREATVVTDRLDAMLRQVARRTSRRFANFYDQTRQVFRPGPRVLCVDPGYSEETHQTSTSGMAHRRQLHPRCGSPCVAADTGAPAAVGPGCAPKPPASVIRATAHPTSTRRRIW